MLPPGPHLVSYNASSGQGDFGPTTSFWLVLKAGQVAVQRWDAATEVLAPLADEDEARAPLRACLECCVEEGALVASGCRGMLGIVPDAC